MVFGDLGIAKVFDLELAKMRLEMFFDNNSNFWKTDFPKKSRR